ncbi:MAG: hypothetical protein KC877_03425 [Candidatus Kaiserbacteria bacterium]|nr:hypothetical protein [Candidatus Kaiserbacteria bacterium]MCB9816326.1 hypothetical protein [Candidatus Nomurabacteria bacterium]
MKKLAPYTLSILLLIPVVTHAQSIQDAFINIDDSFQKYFIPFFLALAFILFAFNAVRYFIIESANQEGREKARSLALYGILAFVMILILWGAVNFIAKAIFGNSAPGALPDQDYVKLMGP